MPQSAIISAFDYGSLDDETRDFLQQQTGEIRALMRRTAQDVFEIGSKLIEIKQRLGHGNYLAWLEAEFAWTDRTARRFISVAEQFGHQADMVSDLDFAPTALYTLAAPSTPVSAREEALARAAEGEAITPSLARSLKEKHLSIKQKVKQQGSASTSQARTNSEVDSQMSSLLINRQSEKTVLPATPTAVAKGALSATEPEIDSTQVSGFASVSHKENKTLEVVSVRKSSDKLWTQLGSHWLFNGHPSSPDFLVRLPDSIALWLNFSTERVDWPVSTDKSIKSGISLLVTSDLENDDLRFFQALFDTTLKLYTEEKDAVVIGFLPTPDLLLEADEWGCQYFIAEPDRTRCQNAIAVWEKQQSRAKK